LSHTGQLGNLIQNISTVDVPGIINSNDVFDSTALANITGNFLGGSGTYGGILVSDLMGTVGGIGIKDAHTAYADAINTISAGGGFNDVNVLYGQISNAINGDYLDVVGDFAASTDHTDPEDSSTHTDLDSFIENKVTQINSEMSNIVAAFPTESAVAGSNWNTMLKKVYDEQQFAGRTDLQLELRNNLKENAYHFVTSHTERADRSDVIQIVEGMQDQAIENGDVFGEYWRAFTAESKNRNIVDPYNIRWRSESLGEFEII